MTTVSPSRTAGLPIVRRDCPITCVSERTRARVVDAATRLFLEHGYVATTIEAIAAEAGVAVPTVYYLFRTKPRLLAAVLDTTVAGPAGTAIVEQSWVNALRCSTGTRGCDAPPRCARDRHPHSSFAHLRCRAASRRRT
jgi:AcrR family transcriptional regulator